MSSRGEDSHGRVGLRPPRGHRRARIGRLLAVAAVGATVLLVGAGAIPASAHAYLATSTPSDGQTLEEPPSRVTLEFTEHVVLESTTVDVVDSDGHRIPIGPLTLEESDEDREAPATVVAELPPLGRGAYRVAWRTLSSDDLHASAGGLAFGVGRPVAAAGPSESPLDPIDTGGRWGALAALAVALGAAITLRLLRALPQDNDRDLVSRRLRRVAAFCVVAGLLVSLAVGLVDVIRFGGTAIGGSYAVHWGAREALLAVTAVALLPRWQRVAGSTSVAALAAIAASAVTVMIGHTGTTPGPTWFVASTAHIVATLTWAGTVAALSWLVARAPALGLPRSSTRPVLQGFRRVAIAAVGVALATGVYLAGDVVVSIDAALLTTYGRMLVAKSALVIVVGIIALGTTRALHPAAPRAPRVPRRRLMVETGALLAVAALGGVLASGQPAVAPQLVAAAPPTVIDDRAVGDLQQTLTIGPNRPGSSIATIDVLDSRRPSPGPVTGVTVTVGGAAPSDAQSVSAARWSAPVTLPATDRVDVSVVVHRRGAADVHSTIPWVVASTAAVPVFVSQEPISGLLHSASLVVAAAFASAIIVMAWIAGRRRRRGARPVHEWSVTEPSAARVDSRVSK